MLRYAEGMLNAYERESMQLKACVSRVETLVSTRVTILVAKVCSYPVETHTPKLVGTAVW